ncbi:MAG: bifunctional DNA-formamidopyrimidine glycosylase/DNA-(apurinic or apyrimidinic site) lyase [Deltaproteobacteria bacterium]|jgi:formamidopyrimidine-DNA glycosylase|nr:bifunctional DNA-formamidopyrimidine glycosylase/DNA-(apurinic or apyrimidinic site) lyase [Deltaproteobacteria bacterium]
MPELPEVETIARTLEPQVQGRYIGQVEVLAEKTVQYGRERCGNLAGTRIDKAWRRAKVLLVDLTAADGQPLSMAFHLKMTGQLFVHAPAVPPHKHTKLVFSLYPDQAGALKGGEPESRLFFDDMRTFGYCRIMRPEDFGQWPFWSKLGLEPLLHGPQELAEAFKAKRGKIKAVLLNQEVVCGIGNIYADEALFRAGIRPDAPTDGLDLGRLARLGQEVREILQESIDACGSSIRDYRDANGNVGAFQNTFRAYGRGGQPCTVCGRTMTACRVAGRGTAYCEYCQK